MADVKGEFHQDQCTAERSVRNLDLAVVRTDYFCNDGKAEPGTGSTDASATPEALENVRNVGRGNTRTTVGHADRSGRRHSDCDFRSREQFDDSNLIFNEQQPHQFPDPPTAA